MMKLCYRYLSVLGVFFSCSCYAFGSFDARSMGMGGIGVSTANYLTAPIHNPALVARFTSDDDFGLLIPAVGAQYQDKDDLINGLDDLSGSLSKLEESNTSANIEDALNDLRKVQGNKGSLQGAVTIAIAFPNRYLSANFYVQAKLDTLAIADVSSSDLNEANLSNTNYTIQSQAMVAGIIIGETGVALASPMQIPYGNLYIGVTPKIQKVKTYNYVVNADSYDFSDFNSSQYSHQSTNFNFDIGIDYDLNDGFNFGLVGKNILAQSYSLKTVKGVYGEYKLSPLYSVSTSYQSQFFTVGMDLDLNAVKRFENIQGLNNNFNSDSDDVQKLALGMEFNAWDYAQLRLGYQIDLQGTLDNQYSAGLGLALWKAIRFDAAVTYADSHSLGGSFQMAYTF